MQKEMVSLFSRIFIPTNIGIVNDAIEASQVGAFNSEIATLGYTFDGEAIKNISALPYAEFVDLRKDVLNTLVEITGADANHQKLFNGFPYSVPDQHDYLERRIYGFLQNVIPSGRNANSQFDLLSCGHAIDTSLFDLSEFGACPICQRQVDELSGHDNVKFAFSNLTPLKVIGHADTKFISYQGNLFLTRNSSLSVTEKQFLKNIKPYADLNRPARVFKETLPFVYVFFDDVEYTKTLLSGATDVLRIIAFISDENADLSLTENVKYNPSTKHKKNIFRMLESLDNLGEDLLRHREKWLRISERIHPSSAKNSKNYPRTAATFEKLHSNQKSIPTFRRAIEPDIRAKNVGGHLIGELIKRPGEYVRLLDYMLRTISNGAEVIDGLNQIIPMVQTRMLFDVEKYFSFRAQQTTRVFVPKGMINKLQVKPDTRKTISAANLTAVREAIQYELARRFSSLPAMGKIHIDPNLKNLVMPFNKRGDSAANVVMTKGSRYPVSGNVLRLFVHWTGRDVDLSLGGYGDKLNLIEQISWTNLHSVGVAHSGDVQRAPDGASEFIDVEVEHFLQKGIRYLAMNVVSYSGETFDTFPCFAGFMERDVLRSGKTYEPASVKLKFDINAKSTFHMPLMFDLHRMEIIYADLSGGIRAHSHMGSNNDKIVVLTQAVLDMPKSKITAYDVIMMHVIARGNLVSTPDEADIVFLSENLDLDKLAQDYIV